MPKTECASISFPSITLLLSFAYVPVTQVCNRRGNITLEIQMHISWLEENIKNCNFNQFLLTSVWTICGRWLRILETNSKTSTFCSACIMSIMASITINVPVRPTPALKKERKKDKKKKLNYKVCKNCYGKDRGGTCAVSTELKYSMCNTFSLLILVGTATQKDLSF